ncbi:MAG: diadenylate cyclase CdaA [Clostridia bacterium]|nr:diadenylate cyclase CdaA [Clostridia bacterium]
MTEAFTNFFLQLREVLAGYRWFADTLDILLVAVIIYALIKQLRRTQSIQILKGIALIAVVYFLVLLFKLETTMYIFNVAFANIFVVVVILFSSEIRQALEHFGSRRFIGVSLFGRTRAQDTVFDAINAVCRACGEMSRDKVGSLIIFQRSSNLGDLEKKSVPIDAMCTSDLLQGIFFPNSALHDGAVIIRNGRVLCARCVVPLTGGLDVYEHVGTRHRAAMEVSAQTDAIAVVTSEETGIISLAVDGKLVRGLSDGELREKLTEYLLSADSGKRTAKQFSKLIRKRGEKRGE